jgi:bacterioferritin-associated ferredoxin
MIVCSCNVLTDSDVRTVCNGGAEVPSSPTRVHGCLGCSPQCGRCLRTIKRIMDEALAGCDVGCQICPHTGRKL